MTVTAEELSLPRLSLEIAVDQLTKPEACSLRRDDGSVIPQGVPSLLAQLADAKEANSGRGGAFAARSKPPLWIDAVSLLREIDLQVQGYGGKERVGRVRAWAGHAHSITDPDVLEAVVEQAEGWVRRARNLLDPDPPIELDGDCPECGRTWIDTVNEERERVRRHALRATETPPLAWCDGCSSRFEGEGLWVLADHLKRQTASETLAVEEPTP